MMFGNPENFNNIIHCRYSSTPRYRSVTDSRYSASANGGVCQWGGPASSSSGVESGTKAVQTGAAYSPAQRSSGAGYDRHQRTENADTGGRAGGSPPQHHQRCTTPLLSGDTAADVRRAVTVVRPSQQNNQPIHHSQCSRRLAEFGGRYAITDDDC